jgi:2-oxoisovalerate dehydrogenase E1 component alpha subunit
METVARFEIGLTRVLDREGRIVGDPPGEAVDPDFVARLYMAMVRTRTFDARAVALQRTGRLGTFASSLGQEAVSVGVAAAMHADDVLLPSFREQGGMFVRGVRPHEVLLYWGGDERGSDFAGPREDFPICVPVGSHFPHAAGVALAFRLRGEPRVAVCIAGDGATSKGDFYEAINLAGAWKVPAVFVISNNQWAISVPRAAQTAAETLAQKAIAAGIPGEQVDGNDVLAVFAATERALDAARSGDGPRVIEALTYRLSDHTTADDAARYRDDAEVSAHWKDDPVARVRAWLAANDGWTKEDEERLIADCAAEIDAEVTRYLETGPVPAAAMFDHLYATLPPVYAAQRAVVADGAGPEEGADG